MAVDINSPEYKAQKAAYDALDDQTRRIATNPEFGSTDARIAGNGDVRPSKYAWDGTAYSVNPNYTAYKEKKDARVVAPAEQASQASQASQAGQAGVATSTPVTQLVPIAPATAQQRVTAPVVRPTANGIIANGMASPQTLTPEQVAQYNPFGDLSPQTGIGAVTSPVQQNELVQGQLQTLLDPSNPLLQRSRSLTLGDMNARGIINSTMAGQAGTTAMIDKALEIATPDAATYANRAMFNATTENETNRFNAGETNRLAGQGADIASQFGLQSADIAAKYGLQSADIAAQYDLKNADIAAQYGLQSNQLQSQSGENTLDRASSEKLAKLKIESDASLTKAQMSHDAAMTNLKIASDAAQTDKSIAAQTNLQKAQQEFAGSQAELDRLYNTNSELQKQLYQSAENDKDRQAQTTVLSIQQAFTGQENALDRQNQVRLLELQGAINNANLPKATAADLILNLGKDIATIAASGDLKADAKTAQINNLYDVANANLAYLSKTYGVDLGTVNPDPTTVTAPVEAVTAPSGKAAITNMNNA